MHLTSTLASLLAVCTLSSAYVVELFAGEHCEGDFFQAVNVYDNTQKNNLKMFKSMRVRWLGGSRQRAHVCQAERPLACPNWRADGSEGAWHEGACLTISDTDATAEKYDKHWNFLNSYAV